MKLSEKDFVVIPSRTGKDLLNKEGTEDAHIRVERYRPLPIAIYVDRFDAETKDTVEAYIGSESFPHTNSGAEEATQFLHKHGFNVCVMIR